MVIKGKPLEKTEAKEVKEPTKIDGKKVNEVMTLSKKFLKIAYILLILGGIYAILIIGKEISLFKFIGTIFKILSPLFIGILVAWLFDPLVRMLQKKGASRGLGTAVVYLAFVLIIMIILWVFVPMLSNEINEFAKTLPGIFESIKNWISNIFDRLSAIDNFDADGMKAEIFKKIEQFGLSLTSSLPEILVNIISAVFSGIGNILVGLIIGFYLLISFEDANETIMVLIPKKLHTDAHAIMDDINTSLRRFVQGALLDCTLVFLVSSLGLWLVGVKSPLLFGLFCGLTNIIPYAGPYIGGSPAVIVGFVQSPLTGILSLIVIFVIQFIEGNFFQPLIMSKTTKLNPVTIMLGLLIFGHFWGILGMIISTPIIASLKAIFKHFDDKYDIMKFN